MKLITRDTDYAVRALRFIAKQDKEMTPVSNLVKKLGIPRPFLRKILQILNKERLLKSYKGKGGGFKLNKKSEKILFIDLIKIFQGPLKLSEHVLKTKVCPKIRSCKLKKKLDKIERYLISELEEITLDSLL